MISSGAKALELDWSGQFRADYNFIHNYAMDNTDAASVYDPNRGGTGTGVTPAIANPNGYYVPAGGSTDATFQSLFLKLRPKIVVNDNIYIKSEFWVGDPVYGMFGNGVPYSTDQRQFYSNQNRGSFITAQRFWAEFLSDIGTVQVGRAPLHWGLGVVWNNGDGLWDRYESTADTIRLVSKFGAFSVVPSFQLYSAGNNVGGSCNFAGGSCSPGQGSGGVSEYTLALKYENADEDFEAGLNFIKRLAGANQDANPAASGGSGYVGPQGVPVGMNYNIWDIYARKKLGRFSLAVEVPLVTGSLGTSGGAGMDYSTYAVATEIGWKPNETFETQVKAGRAPGQPAFSGANPDSFKAFFFNPSYRVGLIMFNYQLANFAGPNTLNNPGVGAQNLRSPYDNPIVNANYLALTQLFHTDKWTFNTTFIYARADQTALAGQRFYNTVSRTLSGNAVKDQGTGLGFEADIGAAFQWDDYFQFRFDTGVFLPGNYWAFSNAANGADNLTSMVFAASAKVGISF